MKISSVRERKVKMVWVVGVRMGSMEKRFRRRRGVLYSRRGWIRECRVVGRRRVGGQM